MKLRPALWLIVMFICMIGISSCVRNYTCQCYISYTGQPGLPDTVIKTYDIKDTKSSAKSSCQSNSKTFDNNGIHTVENCDLY